MCLLLFFLSVFFPPLSVFREAGRAKGSRVLKRREDRQVAAAAAVSETHNYHVITHI